LPVVRNLAQKLRRFADVTCKQDYSLKAG
jgi:hypothetical protein